MEEIDFRERTFEISRDTIERVTTPEATKWLAECLNRFKHLIPPPVLGDGGNLVMMWKRDYDQLTGKGNGNGGG